MIHRALLGSIERFFGILIEHHNGELPLWIAPVQVRVIPVSDKYLKYALAVYEKLSAAGVRAEIETTSTTLAYKIRQSEVERIPYVVVVGKREEENHTVSVRRRGKKGTETVSLEEFIDKIVEEGKIPL